MESGHPVFECIENLLREGGGGGGEGEERVTAVRTASCSYSNEYTGRVG